MKNNNYVLSINGEPSIICRSARKLVWLSLPELNLISKFYTRSNFVQASSTGCLFLLDKNCVSFLTVNLPPLTLNVFRQQFLDWQPSGGICMSHMLILYNKHTINFYDRGNTLKKSWTIEVMQEISQIKSSPQQKVIGMMVIQKNNTIFLWNINDISNKPFQEITISQKIVKWEFYNRDMLTVLTERQFQVYFPSQGHYSLQYFIQFAHTSLDFCFFDRPKTRDHSGRKMVFPVGILSDDGKIFIYELYDIDKRVKNSAANVVAVIQTQLNTKSLLCGYEKDSGIVVCTQLQNGKPLSLTLTPKFLPISRWKYQPELITDNPSKIQYCKQIICVQKNRNKKGDLRKNFEVFRIHGKDQYQFLTSIEVQGQGILGGYNFFSFEGEKLTIFKKNQSFRSQNKTVIEGVKFKNLILLEEGENFAYFVSGIRIIKLDLNENKAKIDGFVVKNDKFSLVQVRNQTRSLLYKSNQEYILFEYVNNQNADLAKNKLQIKLIKSSAQKIVSLRNGRWIEKHPDKILLGELTRLLIQFDLTKFFKLLTQQNQLIDYEVYWTTHDGILLFIKNYLFVLQLTQSSEGYSLNFIKRSLNYLHCRFDPDANGIKIMDARSLVIRQGSRILKLGTKLGNFVGQDPYSLPDTLLRRQLLMRKLYPPHHPKIIQYLIQMGNFNLLGNLFTKLWNWLTQGQPEIKNLYNQIGLSFFIQNKQINSQQKPKQENLQEENPLKKCCELILESPHLLQLQQNGSLILQSQIQAVIFRQQNSRSLDFYSQIVLTQFKTFQTKNENFRTMHIAYLIHSNNKQEAIGILKQQKAEMDWDWMKKYSIPMWYDIKNEIRGWTEEIGSNLFKNSKEPFDCLFWYTITNKKNILIQLFKKYIYNTPEHEKIVKFLQRDFNDPKNRNAAANNAYALVDKKRYLHALAFFIYGQKIDEAISVCLNKLKDFNLAFLICTLMEDNTNKSKLLDILYKQGDIWAKHISLFFKGEHIQSFNVLFEEENLESTLNWNYEPKIVNFHPCVKQFALMIEKSVPVKRELQEQKLSKIKNDPNDIFDSFFGGGSQQQVQEQIKQEKVLIPKYEEVEKESVNFYIHNSCPILALTIQPKNYRANRAYDLCRFMLTKQVNSTVEQLIVQMEDYISIIKSKLKEGKSYSSEIETILKKIRNILENFRFSSIMASMKSSIGELMYFARLGEEILGLTSKEGEQQPKSKEMQYLILISKGFLILQLQITQLFEAYSNDLVSAVREDNIKQREQMKDFWSIIKSYYDKIPEPKKNKKQNLYDEFEQSLYKYVYKKGQLTHQNTNFFVSIEDSITLLYKKIFIEYMNGLFSQNKYYSQFKEILSRPLLSFTNIIKKWVDSKLAEQLQKQYLMMLSEGSVSKLKLSMLPTYLQNKFEQISRSFTLMKSTSLKKIPSEKNQSNRILSQKPQGQEVIQIFRNKLEAPRFMALNKNEGNGMQVVIVSKKGIRKMQVCDSLLNRTRSQDGISLIQDDNMLNIQSKFDIANEQKNTNLPIVDYFLNALMDNRKEYEGVGIIKGSTKRVSPQYFKTIDPLPFIDPSEVFCIQTHHFLPIFMLGGKSNIEICQFSTKSNYNRIKCPNLSEIIKIRSYQQRVTALDNQGNLSSYSFDSKISGTPVFNMKKSALLDFCLMTPSTYGVCTNNSIQVIDSLLHPKKQIVFKVQTNQTPICLDYYSNTKLAVCRRSDLVIYDTRMDVLQQTRDLAGRAKCMISNHKNKLLVGKTDNKVRIINLGKEGGEQDYDIKCISSSRGTQSMDKSSIEDIQLMGRIAISLNSEGTLSMFVVD